ncbi:MAG: hypothetical protein ACI9JZ_000939 [Lentimonas sp.]|jgi:hypothetical protein
MKTLQALSTITALGALLALSACKLASCSNEAAAAAISPGKELVLGSINVHGGIEKWRNKGLFKFRWTYHITDRDSTVESIQIIDPVSFTAVHTVPNSDTTFGRTEDGRYVCNSPISSRVPARKTR